jgi:hypothetical protein
MKNIHKTSSVKGARTMNRKAKSILMRGFITALLASAVFAASAGASPAWKFEGKELVGAETVVGAALDSKLTVPGLTTKCANFLYKLTVENSGGTGKGSLTELPLYECTTNSPEVCTVKSITPETLPWAAKLMTVAPSNYIFIEGIKVSIVYAGVECALGGLTVKVTGTAGGLVDNTLETATFNAASFSATKAKMVALGSTIQWEGVFPTEAFEKHRLEAISAS